MSTGRPSSPAPRTRIERVGCGPVVDIVIWGLCLDFSGLEVKSHEKKMLDVTREIGKEKVT